MMRAPTASARPDAIADLIDQQIYPCLGAKSALATGGIVTLFIHDINSPEDDAALYRAIRNFGETTIRQPDTFHSLAVVCCTSRSLSEQEFEIALWQRLQALSDIDAAEGCSVDPAVSSDPEANDFGLSLGGHAYYVIGMHENASRRARRFPAPAMVFNMRQQFSHLRESGHFETMSQKIKQRDIAYTGSANPMLARHGDVSEARQYSGRVVGSDWRCPFSRKEK